MKRTVLIIMLLASCFSLRSETSALEILSQRQDRRITLSYSFTANQNGTDIQFTGQATAQDNCFRITANGLEIYCDSTAFYVVDRKAKEVCIDSAKSIEDYVIENAGSVKNLKVFDTVTEARSDNLSIFLFDLSALDKNWVITDLR